MPISKTQNAKNCIKLCNYKSSLSSTTSDTSFCHLAPCHWNDTARRNALARSVTKFEHLTPRTILWIWPSVFWEIFKHGKRHVFFALYTKTNLPVLKSRKQFVLDCMTNLNGCLLAAVRGGHVSINIRWCRMVRGWLLPILRANHISQTGWCIFWSVLWKLPDIYVSLWIGSYTDIMSILLSVGEHTCFL